MRTLVDIPEEHIAQLDALAGRNRQSRAATIREAIRLHLLRQTDTSWIDRGAGLWRDRHDIGDAIDYQRAMREDRRADDAI